MVKIVGNKGEDGQKGDQLPSLFSVNSGTFPVKPENFEPKGEGNPDPFPCILQQLGHVPKTPLGKFQLDAIENFSEVGL